MGLRSSCNRAAEQTAEGQRKIEIGLQYLGNRAGNPISQVSHPPPLSTATTNPTTSESSHNPTDLQLQLQLLQNAKNHQKSPENAKNHQKAKNHRKLLKMPKITKKAKNHRKGKKSPKMP